MAKPDPFAKLHFRADADAAQPIYSQLAHALSKAIRGGAIPIGTRLPSERLCAQRLGVSRTTVTAAYQELAARGLVHGHVGRGTIVVADDPERAGTGAVAWSHQGSRLARPAHAGAPVREGAGVITLASGWLHPSLIPSEALGACSAEAARDTQALNTTAPIQGLLVLREALVEILRARGVRASVKDLLVTGGAQQGINVVARALVSPGDAVVCESPTWHGAFRAFRAAGAHVAGVPMDGDGVDAAALEDALLRLRPKLVYLIPSFHCPTGCSMTLQRRRRVLEICARFRTPILESQVYGDAGFADTLPSLKSLDRSGVVIQQGSASKTISAALRLGWLVAPAAAMELLAASKAMLDLSTPTLPQLVIAAFLAQGAYARHLRLLRLRLRERCAALLAALRRHCPQLRCTAPEGGLYLWAQLPSSLHGLEVEAAAAEEGVAVRAGEAFVPEGGSSSYIRLCYAAPAADEIEAGAERLGRALSGLLERHRSATPGDAALASV